MRWKGFAFFSSRTIIVHIVTYVIAGIVAYWIQWGGVYGGPAMPFMLGAMSIITGGK